MAHSYGYYLRKQEREKVALHGALEAMVARGELYKTPEGRYGLTEWLAKPHLISPSPPAVQSASPSSKPNATTENIISTT